VPVEIDWRSAGLDGFDPTRALALCQEFAFRRLADKIASLHKAATVGRGACDGGDGRDQRSRLYEYHLVDTPEALETFVAELKRQKRISFDTETTHVSPRWAELVGLSFSWNDREAWYLPVRAPAGDRRLDAQATLATLRAVLEDPAIEKIGQNLKYDMIVLRAAGIEVAGVVFDTMVASYLLDAGSRSHNINELAKRYLSHTTIKIEELIGSGKGQKRMDQVPTQLVTDYAAEDALLPVLLRPILSRELAEVQLENLFQDVEVPLIDVLVEMEFNGVKVDVQRLAELSRRYRERMDALEEEIYALAGRRFNIASPRQLQEVLFVEQKLPVVKKTAKTGPSTDVDVLETLAHTHPLPAKIVEYRQYAKLTGTYVDALPKLVHPETGRVHASFNQVVTATGRLSSSDPNLQNIPVRNEAGREIRSAFVPGHEGWSLLAADYSQIELRVLAHYSGDARLCEAFLRDEDIHARVASQVNGVPLEGVTTHMRRQAKVVNFGVIYGQGANALSQLLGIEKKTAAEFIDNYYRQYPGIEEFLVRALAECRKTGFVKTILGRRRAISGVRENAGRSRNLAERTAVNTVIQGSAADLIKLAMIAIHRRLRREKLQARLLLQIHDELIFEAPSDQVAHLAALVSEEMAGVHPLRVPLKVDVKAGPTWADAEPL
jgi:DNA polymerase-1